MNFFKKLFSKKTTAEKNREFLAKMREEALLATVKAEYQRAERRNEAGAGHAREPLKGEGGVPGRISRLSEDVRPSSPSPNPDLMTAALIYHSYTSDSSSSSDSCSSYDSGSSYDSSSSCDTSSSSSDSGSF